MQLFYNPNINNNESYFTFDKTESKHIVKVLRKQKGDTVYITNGKGILFESILINSDEKKCQVSIKSFQKETESLNYNLHIAIAPTKNIQRLEWFLEKATEIGITEITPILCKHSERKIIKKERLEKVLISAMKQSLKYTLPKLNEMISFSEFIKTNQSKNRFIAHCIDNEKYRLKQTLQLVKPKENITILIGPEGDFSLTEITFALNNKFKAVSLGNSRLRTETAGVVAVHSVAFTFE